jgi:hypothetical protein
MVTDDENPVLAAAVEAARLKFGETKAQELIIRAIAGTAKDSSRA